MSVQATQSHSSFVPHIPDFSESFFDIEKPFEESNPNSFTPPQKLFKEILPLHLNIAQSSLSSEDLQRYRQFLSECLSHSYLSSPFGIICPAHPEAKHPYPGQMPEDPHENQKVVQQFIQRGISKKFREEERNYKNNFRHWQVQMNQHLAEVPKLKARDSLFKSYVSLVQTNYRDAQQEAQEALQHFANSPTAYALLAVMAYEQGDIEKAKKHEQQLKVICPSLPIGDFGHHLLHEMVQDNLSSLYVQTCQDACSELQKQEGVIPFQKDYLVEQVQRNLWKNLQKTKEKDIDDLLDLIGLHFLEETLFEGEPDNLSTLMQDSFGYISLLFEHLEKNLDLIKAHSINISSSLKNVLESKKINKEHLVIMIEELSKPLVHGDPKLKRQFMNHAMHIHLYRLLFEMNAKELFA